MNKKAIVAVFCGALAAGVLCLVAGLIVYYTAKGNVVSLLIGLFTIATGIIIAAAAVLALIIVFIIILVTKSKNKNE